MAHGLLRDAHGVFSYADLKVHVHEVAGKKSGAFIEPNAHEARTRLRVDGLGDVVEFARERAAALVAEFDRIVGRHVGAVERTCGRREDDPDVVVLGDRGKHGACRGDERAFIELRVAHETGGGSPYGRPFEADGRVPFGGGRRVVG